MNRDNPLFSYYHYSINQIRAYSTQAKMLKKLAKEIEEYRNIKANELLELNSKRNSLEALLGGIGEGIPNSQIIEMFSNRGTTIYPQVKNNE